jgi:hypothetical protein
VWPFEDEVIREQLPHADPIPGLNSAPELDDNLARLHAPIIRRQVTLRNAGAGSSLLLRWEPLDQTEATGIGVIELGDLCRKDPWRWGIVLGAPRDALPRLLDGPTEGGLTVREAHPVCRTFHIRP